MTHTYWENLQPFVNDEEPPEPFKFDQLSALYVSLQSALVAARELAWQVTVATRNQPEADSSSAP